MEKTILTEFREWGAVVTLNRPDALNALNREILEELMQTLEQLDQRREVRAIIITGSGTKAFAAGADISAMRSMTPPEAKAFSSYGQSVMNRISKMRAIVIAAVNGYALGGGCELALACDIRIASSNAKFGIPEVSLGVIPGFGGTQRLSRIAGIGRAIELMATAGQMAAEDAFRIGLVNRVTEPGDLLNVCEATAEKIARNSASAVALGKQSILGGSEMDLTRALDYEAGLFALTFSEEDQAEGMTAFLEKRRPRFRQEVKA